MLLTLLLTLCATPQDDGLWIDATELGLEGQAWEETALPYDRLPAKAEGVVRDAVWNLSRQSSGLVLRFTTDSRNISARWKLGPGNLAMPHMPASAMSGLDLYVQVDGAWKWLAATKPSSLEPSAKLASNLPPGTRDYLLYLPLYKQTLSLEVGFDAKAWVNVTDHSVHPGGQRPNRAQPIVFYGTSITHGASASRPGMTHPAILGRRLDHSIVNLGFSGNGRMELELADLLAEIPARVYVLDCLPNMNPKMVAERAAPFVRRLRELRPDTPIVMVEDRINANAHLNQGRATHHAMNRRALRAAYEALLGEGQERLHYIPGAWLLGDDTLATIDGSHPTDLGFMRMADVFEPVLREALKPLQPDATANAVVPSAAQLDWHRMQYYAFVHFNMNTFTDIEWGHGTEDPKTFHPTDFDARQWCRIFKDAGMKAVILTAKHHDGFCLWPSAQTKHDVAASDWLDGKGDVLRELSEACIEYGLKFGVYLSPWDRNHPLYGTGEAYNQAFAGQLEEVLTQYGPVFEVWFDGANGEGPNGKKQIYDWDLFHETVFRHQPEAIIFSDVGPGCRWVGNERGYAAETNWNTLNVADYGPGTPNYHELTEGNRGGTHWVPAEADVSIRPGWYYHPDQDDKVKSNEDLLAIWYASVGQGANLLLNIPVDRRGQVHPNDEAALRKLRASLDSTFAQNVLSRFGVYTTSTHDNPDFWGNVFDSNPETYWIAGENRRFTLRLHPERVFDHLVLQEAIHLGQRVAAFRVEADGKEIARGTTIGANRILRFDAVKASRLDIVFEESDGVPTLAGLQAYKSPAVVELVRGELEFLGKQSIELRARNDSFATVLYTLDGSAPNIDSKQATGPITIDRSCTLRAIAVENNRIGTQELRIKFVQLSLDQLQAATAFIRQPDAGLRFAAYEDAWQTLDQMKDREPSQKGTVATPSLAVLPREEMVALAFTGWIQVPADGVYTFSTSSDDGSRWWFGDRLIVENDGLHGAITRSGRIGLQAGWHAVRIEYFNARGGKAFDLSWAGPGVSSGAIPEAAWAR